MTTNSVFVSKLLGLRTKAQNPSNIFAMDYNGRTEFVMIEGMVGRKGRPGLKKQTVGFGCQTHTILRNLVTGRKSTVLLSTLIDRNLRKLGKAKTVSL